MTTVTVCYEVAKGQYLIVEDAELKAIEIESTHTIETHGTKRTYRNDLDIENLRPETPRGKSVGNFMAT